MTAFDSPGGKARIDQAFFDAFRWCNKCQASHHPSNTFCDGLRQPQLALPVVHLNGTSREALQDAYRVAYEALTQALAAVNGTGPNARDYYVQPHGAFQQACAEHLARLDALAKVRDQMLVLHDACSEGAQQLRLQLERQQGGAK